MFFFFFYSVRSEVIFGSGLALGLCDESRIQHSARLAASRRRRARERDVHGPMDKTRHRFMEKHASQSAIREI